MTLSSVAFSVSLPTSNRWGCNSLRVTNPRRAHHVSAPARSRGPTMNVAGKKVLVVGGTRFAGLYLVHELSKRGADVTVLNRGNTPLDDLSLSVPGETEADFKERAGRTKQLVADRTNASSLRKALSGESFDVIFDNNGRERSDSAPLADIASNMDAHFVYMSSAGVYRKSPLMPHVEGDAVDEQCRHRGKLETEAYLQSVSGLSWTAIRPTYIYGAKNYNPLEQWFFERVDEGRPVCVPGHGMHLTGLGHVQDLAAMMAACGATEAAKGQIFNVQDNRSISFDGVVELCAKVAGKPVPEIVHYDPSQFNFGKKKAFPFRPQHFFTSAYKALDVLDWEMKYDLEAGFRDSYENDFVMKKAAGKLKNDFETDDKILAVLKDPSLVS